MQQDLQVSMLMVQKKIKGTSVVDNNEEANQDTI